MLTYTLHTYTHTDDGGLPILESHQWAEAEAKKPVIHYIEKFWTLLRIIIKMFAVKL